MSHDNPPEKARPGSGETPAAAMEVIEHTRCRLCGSGDLDDIHSFGDFYVSNFVDEAHSREGVKAPLDLIMCNRCSLLQLRHTAPMELMYARHYWYRSGVTETMRTALRDVSATIEEMVGLGPGDVVLDIGANDGTLLASYAARGIVTVGCQAADNLIGVLAKSADHVIHRFRSAEAARAVRS